MTLTIEKLVEIADKQEGKKEKNEDWKADHKEALEIEKDLVEDEECFFQIVDRMRDISRFSRDEPIQQGTKKGKKGDPSAKYDVFPQSYSMYPEIYAEILVGYIDKFLGIMGHYLSAIHYNIPGNAYNIKGVLDSLSSAAFSGDPDIFLKELSTVHYDISNPIDTEAFIYSNEDRKIAWEEGFEEGYRRAVKAMEGTLTKEESERIKNLTID